MVESGGWCWWVNCLCLLITSFCWMDIQPAVSNKQNAQGRIPLSAVSAHNPNPIIQLWPLQCGRLAAWFETPSNSQLEDAGSSSVLGSIHPVSVFETDTKFYSRNTVLWTVHRNKSD